MPFLARVPRRFTTSVMDLNLLSVRGNLHTTHNASKTISPLLKFIKSVFDYIGLRNSNRDQIGPNSFSCKSSTTHFKIQTDNPENLRN